jgi:hypothetical protein
MPENDDGLMRDLAKIAVNLFRLVSESQLTGAEGHRLYCDLAELFAAVGALLRRRHVDGKEDFLAAWGELRAIMCFDPASVACSFEQLHRGEFRPLAIDWREYHA